MKIGVYTKMNIKKWITTSIMSASLLLVGCVNSETTNNVDGNKENEMLKVYTTIFPLEDFTKKIGGDYVDVNSIYPPNVDAHSFEPSTKDMIALAESDLFIYTGVGVEGFADKAAEALKNEDVTILAAGEGINLIHSDDEENHGEGTHDDHSNDEEHHEEDTHDDHAEENGNVVHEHEESTENDHSDENSDEHHDLEHGTTNAEVDTLQVDEDGNVETDNDNHTHEEDDHRHGDGDPHIWLDPILSIELAEQIKNTLSELMPAHANEFEQNFTQLQNDLKKLDEEFKTKIQEANTKHILVAHSAYGYWEKRYGIKQIAISGLSPSQEPSQKSLQLIIEESKEHQVPYVIFDQNLSARVAEVIQKEIGAEALTLHNLETITEENSKQADDYFSIMRANLQTIETALNH